MTRRGFAAGACAVLAAGACAVAVPPGAAGAPAARSHRDVGLSAVDATSSSDVWAVGSQLNGSMTAYPTALHYDGHRWTTYQLPAPGTFSAVAAISADDVWAVGQSWRAAGRPLAYHWDGTSWTQVSTPGQAHPIADFTAVAAVSADDVYGFGYSEEESGAGEPFVLHWDGTSWTPARGLVGELTAMSVLGPTDAWAVGTSAQGKAVVAHWDGARWQRVSAPRAKAEWLVGVSAVSSDDVWAYGESHGGKQNPFLEHWDGSNWSVVDDDAAPPSFMILDGLDGTGPSDAWLVGTGQLSQGPLLQHWDGSAWSNASDPAESLPGASLRGVVALSPADAWAVGSWVQVQGGTQFWRRVILHWDGSSWTRYR